MSDKYLKPRDATSTGKRISTSTSDLHKTACSSRGLQRINDRWKRKERKFDAATNGSLDDTLLNIFAKEFSDVPTIRPALISCRLRPNVRAQALKVDSHFSRSAFRHVHPRNKL